jgi:hypothetical protein
MNESIKSIYMRAESELDQAWEEMCRPSTDVVTYSACVGSRRALYHYLQVLAVHHSAEKGEVLNPKATMEDLINYCNMYDERLSAIDFSPIQCRCQYTFNDGSEEVRYCDSVDKVQACVEFAKQVKVIVQDRTGLA